MACSDTGRDVDEVTTLQDESRSFVDGGVGPLRRCGAAPLPFDEGKDMLCLGERGSCLSQGGNAVVV